MRRIYTISLANHSPAMQFAPYLSGLLQAYAAEDDHLRNEYEFQDPGLDDLRSPAQIVSGMRSPSVIALSCYVWNFNRQMKLARLCKERFPEALVVAGGPHVPRDPADVMTRHPYLDVLVHGEGEVPFHGILSTALSEPRDFAQVPGISYRCGDQLRTNPKTDRLDLRSRRFSPYTDGFLSAALGRWIERNPQTHVLWETNRGCPYACSFCDWGSATMSSVRQFDMDRLLAEAEYFGRMKVDTIAICDANFGMLKRDVEIAHSLVESRRRFGYPRQVLVNFAKNANDRVFEITTAWAKTGIQMEMGATLSMQSVDESVLKAIQRANIGVKRYRELQVKYADAGIHTYTELILGLPGETIASFKRGIAQLLEAGNHNDIRVYELSILPNAPISAADVMARYALKPVMRHVRPYGRATPDDEIETEPIVFETSTLTRDEWVECAVFSRLVQCLHNQHYTRYVAMYMHHNGLRSYERFYDGLLQSFRSAGDTVLGEVLGGWFEYFTDRSTQEEWPRLEMARSRPWVRETAVLAARPLSELDWGWLCLSAESKRFYAELREWLRGTNVNITPEIDDLLRYQSEVMIRPEYDPSTGSHYLYCYNWPAHFHGGGPLEPVETRVHYRDTHLGPRREYKLQPNDPRSFVHAAIGARWPIDGSGHYVHQFDAATVQYGTKCSVAAP